MPILKGQIKSRSKCSYLNISTTKTIKINRFINSIMRIKIKLALIKRKLTSNGKWFKPRIPREGTIRTNSYIISKMNRQLWLQLLIIKNNWISSGENWLLALRKNLSNLKRFHLSALRHNKNWPNSDSQQKSIKRRIFQN
jgi:hypothetical protein